MHFQSTLRVTITGLLCAIFLNIYAYSTYFDLNWGFSTFFPFTAASSCLGYMMIFFHELGHTIASWFHGIVTLPTFDFQHGGGMARQMAESSLLVMVAVNLGIVYFIYTLQGYRFWQLILAGIIVFNIATTFNDAAQNVVIYYMGPLSVPLIAMFFLFRALFDLCPRGVVERLLNATFGFAFIFNSIIEGLSLIDVHSVSRIAYFNQKGGHGVGDFDKIASYIPSLSFNGAVIFCIIFNLICLAVPFFVYFYDRYTHSYNYKETPQNDKAPPKNTHGQSTYADDKYRQNTFGGQADDTTERDTETKP